VFDVQRGGPSTGLPTKTEQADLLQVMFGRHGEAPLIVLAAATPADCFETALEACRLTVEHRTPVVVLSDGFIANGAEPWKLPEIDELPSFSPDYHVDPDTFEPYARDATRLSRPWALPGTPGLEHRVGGLEKDSGSGNVSYDADNHAEMTRLRQEKVDRVARFLPDISVEGDSDAPLLVLGWGSTYGAISGAVHDARKEGLAVAQAHLRYLNPFPSNLGSLLERHERVLVPENNSGQLAFLLQGRFVKAIESLPKVAGHPFKKVEILEAIRSIAGER